MSRLHPLALLAFAGGAVAGPSPSVATCPPARGTAAFVHWAAPEHASPPPIDRRPDAHLRVATFALG